MLRTNVLLSLVLLSLLASPAHAIPLAYQFSASPVGALSESYSGDLTVDRDLNLLLIHFAAPIGLPPSFGATTNLSGNYVITGSTPPTVFLGWPTQPDAFPILQWTSATPDFDLPSGTDLSALIGQDLVSVVGLLVRDTGICPEPTPVLSCPINAFLPGQEQHRFRITAIEQISVSEPATTLLVLLGGALARGWRRERRATSHSSS